MSYSHTQKQSVEAIKHSIINQFKSPDAAIHYLMANTYSQGHKYSLFKAFYLEVEKIRMLVETLNQDESIFQINFIEDDTFDPDEDFVLANKRGFGDTFTESVVEFIDEETIKFEVKNFIIDGDNYEFEKIPGSWDKKKLSVTYNVKTGKIKAYHPDVVWDDTVFGALVFQNPGAGYNKPENLYLNFSLSDDFKKKMKDSVINNEDIHPLRRKQLSKIINDKRKFKGLMVPIFSIFCEIHSFEIAFGEHINTTWNPK